ncbi:FKBP-type peptidyl-prolyl cis-trans isomerase [Paraurantiacibacter namhicola]|uniref:Peptidyl-prolyl cis-trans isomerase n=1 Tax=Paraurantiacibacter namhicola TaxID=645517 RepID=A0A1C7D7P4_9SPHN|nr:FKBP-type peptidyl-prolyl cis-trans isomerase [Paraurantiacibacter namhicola]ANU07457.1 Peptidyl-prolyl cis-trans isomerase Mip precursor [Paraurantiacibacter namhicola]
MKHLLATAAALALALPSAASAEQAGPSDSEWLMQQQIALSSLNAKDGWSWLPGGVMWRRVAGDGTGARPTVEDTVTVHYRGTFVDGEEFDSSYKRGEPAQFPLGRLIKAWQLAIPMAGVGDTIEIAVPASMGYGAEGKGPIPGAATLMFTIELIDIAE